MLPHMCNFVNVKYISLLNMLLSLYKYDYSVGFPGGSAGKESAWNVGDLGLIPGLGRSPGEGINYPFQYSGLETSMDWVVHGVDYTVFCSV